LYAETYNIEKIENEKCNDPHEIIKAYKFDYF